jgi:outer membrane protein TolC
MSKKSRIYSRGKIKMKLKILRLIFLAGLINGDVISQPSDSTLILSNLIQELQENNPNLESSYQNWQATIARVPQAGALPDPMLGINLQNLPINSFRFDQEPMTGKQISLVQKFPFPGKLGLQQKIAIQNTKISEMQYLEMKNQLVYDLEANYFELFYVDKATETSEKNAALLKQFTQIAETRYRVGKGLQQDVLKSQVEYSRISDRLINLRQRREVLEAKINILLNRPPGKFVGRTIQPNVPRFHADIAELKQLTDEHRPLLLSWQSVITQSNQKVQLANKSYLPDFSLGVAYTQREVLQNGMGGVDFLSGMFNISIPIYFWKKQRKNVAENKFNEISVRYFYEGVQQKIYGELDITLSEIDKNRQRLDLYKDAIIPLASQALKSSLAAYQVDKVDFLTLVSNQLTLFNYELEYFRALSDYFINIAKLGALVGTNFENLEN